jgi:hypothetical protein
MLCGRMFQSKSGQKAFVDGLRMRSLGLRANFGCTQSSRLEMIAAADHMGLGGMAMKAVPAVSPDGLPY